MIESLPRLLTINNKTVKSDDEEDNNELTLKQEDLEKLTELYDKIRL